MSEQSNISHLPMKAPVEDPNSALSNLYKFQAQNPLLATGASLRPPAPCSPNRSPSNTPGSPSPMSGTPSTRPPSSAAPAYTKFEPSRMSISSAAYASSYRPPRAFPSRSHMPSLAPRPTQQPTYPPALYQQKQQLSSLTRPMIVARIHKLLSDNLDSSFWTKNTDAFVQLSERMASLVTYQGNNGNLGHNGLSDLNDIFICIGHEGTKHYMCLAVRSNVSDVIVFLKGQSYERDGKDPMHDKTLMQEAKEGFSFEAMNAYWNIVAEKTQNGNAWKR